MNVKYKDLTLTEAIDFRYALARKLIYLKVLLNIKSCFNDFNSYKKAQSQIIGVNRQNNVILKKFTNHFTISKDSKSWWQNATTLKFNNKIYRCSKNFKKRIEAEGILRFIGKKNCQNGFHRRSYIICVDFNMLQDMFNDTDIMNLSSKHYTKEEHMFIDRHLFKYTKEETMDNDNEPTMLKPMKTTRQKAAATRARKLKKQQMKAQSEAVSEAKHVVEPDDIPTRQEEIAERESAIDEKKLKELKTLTKRIYDTTTNAVRAFNEEYNVAADMTLNIQTRRLSEMQLPEILKKFKQRLADYRMQRDVIGQNIDGLKNMFRYADTMFSSMKTKVNELTIDNIKQL